MRKNVPQSILNAYILIMVHKLLEKNTYDFVMKANITNICMYFVFHLFIFMFNDLPHKEVIKACTIWELLSNFHLNLNLEV